LAHLDVRAAAVVSTEVVDYYLPTLTL